MAKRKALGKGLSALIPDASPPEVGRRGGGLFSVRIEEISPNRYQPRKTFDDLKISELAASIEESGIIQPLIVRETDDGYELIAGERRLRAAAKAGMETVPVVIKDVSDTEILEMALIENIQREDLNPIEEAMAYQRLINEFQITQEKMAQKVGKDRTTITNSIRLLTLPEDVKHDLAQGDLFPGHARALLSLANEESILKARKMMLKTGMSVRQAESLVKKMKGEDNNVISSEPPDPYLQDLEDELTRSLGTRVKITVKGSGGKVEIEYYSDQELERITEILRSSQNTYLE